MAINMEIDRLKHRTFVKSNLQKRLKDYLMSCMKNAGYKKLEYPTITVSVHKNNPSVEILREDLLPDKYLQIIQVRSIDRRLLADDLKIGDVPGAHLITEKTHLRIR
jgi:hypothetical protein